MAKLVITIPAQVFEYDIDDETADEYYASEPDDQYDFFEAWVSDTWPDMDWKLVD